MKDRLIEIFITEAHELLLGLEKALLTLEQDLSSKEGVSSIFRAMHTLKGSAGMFGYDTVNKFTHHLESIYQDIRDAKRSMNAEVLGITLKALDHLRELMDDPHLKNGVLKAQHDALLQEIKHLNNAALDSESSAIDASVSNARVGKRRTFYVYFLPNPTMLKGGNNTLYLAEDVLALGQGIALPFFNDLPSLENIVPDNSYLGFEIVLSTASSLSEIMEVFMFVETECTIDVKPFSEDEIFTEEIGQELTSTRTDLSRPLGFLAIQSVLQKKSLVKNEGNVTTVRKRSSSSIRVDSDRLDELMNLVSELVTTQARLSVCSSQSAVDGGASDLSDIAEDVEKITRRLRDSAFNMSLVPLENLVTRFQRLVRDLSKELNKEIQFKAEGTETALDKSVVEKLTDPLLHLLRNCIDHGIEPTQDRLDKGKTASGTVLIRAYYSGANVVIEISDDGAGINLDKIRQKAIGKGLIQPHDHLSEKELIDLIFLPGFSTAQQVTGISGRGVGMDVVKRNIKDIRGEVSVTTELGQGTTFIITLPVSLSILDGMLVRVGDTNFILPLGSVAKCYEVETAKVESAFNHWTTLEGNRIPYFFLRDDFRITEHKPLLSQIINVSHNGTHIGLVVDKVEGEYQAVLKPLGRFYTNQDEFSGASILGNGNVALVIDPNKLIRKLTQEHKNRQL